MEKKSWYQAGDVVEFTFRGVVEEGTVVRTRYYTRKGKARELALQVTGDPHSLDRVVVEIALAGRGIATVEITAVNGVKGKGDAKAAIGQKQAIIATNYQRGRAVYLQSYEIVKDLEYGAAIQVQTNRGEWLSAFYHGIIKESGNIRYSMPGSDKTRTLHPKFVRLVPAG